MNVVIHNLRKDGRRFALPFAIWLVLLAGRTGMELWRTLREPGAYSPFAGFADGAIPVLYWICTVLLAAWIVIEDTPEGTTAFWLTRPLGARGVVTEKLCLLAGIVALPILIELATLAALGASASMIAREAGELALAEAPAVLAAAAFAATAESLGRFALNAIFTLIGAGLVSILARALQSTWLVNRPDGGLVMAESRASSMSLSSSRLMAALILAISVALAVLVWRYRWRLARYPLAVVAGCAVLVFLAPIWWPWDFLRPRAAAFIPASHPPIVFRGGFAGRNDPDMPVEAEAVEPAGPPDEIRVMEPSLPALTLATPGQKYQQNVLAGGPSLPPVASYSPEALARALAPARILNPPRRRALSVSLHVRSDRVPLHQPLHLTGEVVVSLRRVTRELELPLRAGEGASWGIRQIEIDRIDPAPEEAIRIEVIEGIVQSSFTTGFDLETEGWAAGADVIRFGSYGEFFPAFALVNPSRQEAVLLAVKHATPEIHYQDYRRFRVVLGPAPSWKVSKDWLAGATLVRLRTVETARTTGIVDCESGAERDLPSGDLPSDD